MVHRLVGVHLTHSNRPSPAHHTVFIVRAWLVYSRQNAIDTLEVLQHRAWVHLNVIVSYLLLITYLFGALEESLGQVVARRQRLLYLI